MITWWKGVFLLIFVKYVICETVESSSEIITEVINDAIVGHNYSTYSVNSSIQYLFSFKKSSQAKMPVDDPFRVTVECNSATRLYPVLVVLRQAKGVLSWQLPLVIPSSKNDRSEYHRTSRTLCPNSKYEEKKNTSASDEVIIIVSSSSPHNLKFYLRLDVEEDFVVSKSENRSLIVSPSEPKFYEFQWPKKSSQETVVLQVDSDSEICMVVSIQNISCPVFDLERTVQYEGIRQTVARKGGIMLLSSDYPRGFYIVLIVKGDDHDCNTTSAQVAERYKHVTFSFIESISQEQYINATLSVLALFTFVYFMVFILSCVFYFRKGNNLDYLLDDSAPPVQSSVATTSAGDGGLPQIEEDQLVDKRVNHLTASQSENSSLMDDDESTDSIQPDQYNFRFRENLVLCDLARKDPRALRKRSLMYFWNLLIVATFYTLPVVQLVLSSQSVLQETGNQDLCYYNFLCAHPWGYFRDFNHVYSNIGYVLLGLLFVILVYRKDTIHCNAIAQRKELDRSYGIPQHYGLLYAMGAALIMEGILSGCYHVCPSHTNFQFDSSFMYVIALLCMIKIYHSRHPDINASASATFGVLALIILVGVAGVLQVTTQFLVFFTCLHISMCLWLSCQVYYMGSLRFGFRLIKRAWHVCREEMIPNPKAFFKPRYPSRMVLLVLGNVANWYFAAAIWIYDIKNIFATYLLAIFMANLMLYTVFYIIMKLKCGEKLLYQPLCYLILATFSWAAALYFFLKKSTSWSVTPAESRKYNAACMVLDFYDRHDIWHFLSAFSMFFSFMVFMTLDDDLTHVPRIIIKVF